MDERVGRKPCCSIGYGGDLATDGRVHIWWLPHGYAVTPDDRIVCVFPDEDGALVRYHDENKQHHPIVVAVARAIEVALTSPP